MAREIGLDGDRGRIMPKLLTEAMRLGSGSLRLVLAWRVARTLLRLSLSGTTAVLVGGWVMADVAGAGTHIVLPVVLVLATAVAFGADRAEATAQTRLAARVRSEAGARFVAMPARAVQSLPAGEVVIALQRHPEAIANLAIGHRAARRMLVIGPACATGALLCVSWQAAAIVALLTPVMVVFFVLVGEAIRNRAEIRERAFGRLAGQFADRIRALPTILANHAVAAEAAKLEARLETHARETMGVLRIAFLNAGVIDFFSSLSIAVLAVLLGLGHLGLATIPGFDGLALWQSLFILMISPDYFAPFRHYAEQYHAKADGLAAAAALERLTRPAVPALPMAARIERMVSRITLPERGLLALRGPSGSGKSTLLRRLAEVEPEGMDQRSALRWIATDSFMPEGTLAQAIAWNSGYSDEVRVLQAAGQVGLLNDSLLPGGLDAYVKSGGRNLSGGQRLRIAIARACLAEGPLFADEPTAKLDAGTAALVRACLREVATNRLVVVATHDPALVGLAQSCITLGPSEAPEMAMLLS